MSRTNAAKLVLSARNNSIAVGAFNVILLEHAEALVHGAELAKLPVILQISENCVSYHKALKPISVATIAIAESSSVPVSVHLDHAESEDLVREALDLGYDSIMFDGSKLSYADNVAASARMAALCKSYGATLEVEIGEVGGKDGVHAPGVRTNPLEAKAFADFSKLSDEAQQSGDPALVSQQQRSTAGRLILAFQNTPMQYTRLMKKSAQDLINGRGDAKTHVSKILYYGAVQNFIFNALQNALFALIPGFDEDEEDDEKASAIQEKKATRILNGMVDSVLRGTGMYGAVVSTLKNTIMKFKEQEEKGFKADHTYTIIEAANISPPIGSKLRKIYSGIQTYRFDKDVIKKHPWDVTIDGEFNLSPSYSIIGNVASATLNIPLDRAIMEAQGIAEALDARNTKLQRVALALGWRTWDVGAKNEEFDLIKAVAKLERKEQGKVKAKKTREENKEKERQRVANMTEAEYNAYMDAKIEKRRASARKAAETRRQNRK